MADGKSERKPMEDDYSLVVTAAPDPAEVQAIRGGLEAHNAAQGAPGDWVPLGHTRYSLQKRLEERSPCRAESGPQESAADH